MHIGEPYIHETEEGEFSSCILLPSSPSSFLLLSKILDQPKFQKKITPLQEKEPIQNTFCTAVQKRFTTCHRLASHRKLTT